MPLTHWPIQSNDLPATLTTLGMYETPINGCIRAVFTRQPQGPWTYYIGQCVLDGVVGQNAIEVYPNFAFVSKAVDQGTTKGLLHDLTGSGVPMPEPLPPIRLPPTPHIWQEEIIPTHERKTSMRPFRCFTVSIGSSAFMPDGQLVDFRLPYRRSAAAYIGEFMSLKTFHGDSDGRRGQFTLEVADRRGAIRLAGGTLSIREPTVPLRLTGTLCGQPVDLHNGDIHECAEMAPDDPELWLLAEDSKPVDFMSASYFPHRYEPPTPERESARQQEERYTQLIGSGESEQCEFKPHVEVHGGKAFELEKTVCAFSNQKGGTLLIGVEDDGNIVGLARGLSKRSEPLEQAASIYQDEIRKRLQDNLKDNQCFDVDVVSVMGARLIAVNVRQASMLNYVTQGEVAQTAFIRHGATSFKMAPPDIQARGGRQLPAEQDVQAILQRGFIAP
jgi:hypothetical protein